MLQFLQGWLWLFAAVAALPVILHLLSRQRLKKIRFSSLMLLSRLEKSQMRRLRLRQLLLLILRTLAVLALVAAFTRPLIRNREAPLMGEETAAVLILDESASMSALGSSGRRIDRARTMARRITASLSAGDRLAAGPDTGSSLSLHFRHNSGEWDRIIDSMSAGSGRADLGAAVAAGRAHLDSVSAGSKELYVVTDGQRTSWSTLPPATPSDVRVYLAPVYDELQPNRSLRELDLGGSLVVGHAPLSLRVTVANHGPEVRDLPVSLFLDGSRVTQQSVTIPRDDSTVVALAVADLDPGWHFGRVAASSDAWPDDNQVYFTLEAADRLAVLVVGERKDILVPIQAALRPGPAARTPFEPETVSRAAFATDIDPRFGLVVLVGVESIPPAAWERLLRFVRSGGGLWVLLDPTCNAINYNQNLLGPVWQARLIDVEQAVTQESFVTLERPARHPLHAFLENMPDYPEIRFRRHASVGGVADDRVRQRFSDGAPAVLEAGLGAGRIVLLTGYARPDESDLIYHPLFVPMVQSTATYVARRGALGTQPHYRVGERPPGLPRSEGDWRWVTPANDTLALPGGPLTLPVMRRAGIYTLLLANQPAAYYAANLDSSELRLEPVEDWEDVLGNVPFVVLERDDDVSARITGARIGIDLWYPALLFGLLLLIAEMLVAWPRRSELEPRGESVS
jgi:hypothetical protein